MHLRHKVRGTYCEGCIGAYFLVDTFVSLGADIEFDEK